MWKEKGLTPAGPADKRTLLRRVYLDLIGFPPTPAEQDAFLEDESPDAYEKVVDRLAGQRAARRPLCAALARCAALCRCGRTDVRRARHSSVAGLGHQRAATRYAVRPVRADATDRPPHDRTHADVGHRLSVARGAAARRSCLRSASSRAARYRDNKITQELPIVAVETVSTAFMGMTVGCAKCHDHMYDPISQKDFYAMKALFDPLVVHKVTLASPRRSMAQRQSDRGSAEEATRASKRRSNALIAPYKDEALRGARR